MPQTNAVNQRARSSALKKWSRRHFKILTAIGGLIVSAALAIKDRYQEQLRDLSASIESEEKFFQLRQATNTAAARIDDLRDELSLGTSGSGDENTWSLKQEMQTQVELLNSLFYSIGNLRKRSESDARTGKLGRSGRKAG